MQFILDDWSEIELSILSTMERSQEHRQGKFVKKKSLIHDEDVQIFFGILYVMNLEFHLQV